MIRPIASSDIPACASLISAAFLTVANDLGLTPENAPRFTAFATTPEKLEVQLKVERRPMYAYVSPEGTIIGYYSLALLEEGICELNNLCVHPECRHQKIGEALLDHAFQQAKAFGCSKMQIGIVEENLRLRRWYESKGFMHTGTQKFDFFPFTCGYMEIELH